RQPRPRLSASGLCSRSGQGLAPDDVLSRRSLPRGTGMAYLLAVPLLERVAEVLAVCDDQGMKHRIPADLRERAVAAVEGGQRRPESVRAYGIAPRTWERWLATHRPVVG